MYQQPSRRADERVETKETFCLHDVKLVLKANESQVGQHQPNLEEKKIGDTILLLFPLNGLKQQNWVSLTFNPPEEG